MPDAVTADVRNAAPGILPGPTPAADRVNPSISIIVPVHNGGEMLRLCLECLQQHAPEDCEIIVVDDCSTDSSAELALSFGATLVRAERRGGPSAARNSGAQVARGETLVFLDADVCVNRDTLGVLIAPFSDESVGAVFGSYNSDPSAHHLISRFRNLLHHYVHQTASEEAFTFWAGCGAVRRELFHKVGGFDAEFTTPSVEDIDFGLRLRNAGHRIVITKQAQVTHLKRWTLWTMCITDLWRRGIPWSRLILREKSMPNDLNVKMSQRLSVILTFILMGLFGIAAWNRPWVLLIPMLFAIAIQILDKVESRRRFVTWATSVMAVGGGAIWAATHSATTLALGLAGTLAIWLVNADFYRFLSRSEGRSFAIAVFPVHLLYYVICGLAFVIAVSGHLASSAWPTRRHRAKQKGMLLPEHELV